MLEQPGDARVREEHERAAARLREHAPEVLRRWEAHVREALPVARDLDQATVHSNLHEVLTQIADMLVTSIGEDAYAYARIPASTGHARQRAELEGYTLDLIIVEYHLLRKAIIEVMEQGEPLPQEVSSVIHDGIDCGMQEAAVHLVETHQRAGEAHEAARGKLIQQLLTAQEEERRRISRELHDRSGQHLTALLLGLKALETPASSPASELLEKLRGVATELSKELHDLSVQLRPLVLDDLGLCPALLSYLEEWGAQAGVTAEFHSTGVLSLKLPPAVETTIYRVVQEALTNVLRHAQATGVSVHLERRPGEVRAIVEDNGCGFDAGAVSPERLGILGMRERAGVVKGTLQIESSPGKGTAVFLCVPLPAGETSGAG